MMVERPIVSGDVFDRLAVARRSPGSSVALLALVLAAGALAWWFFRPAQPPVESTIAIASASTEPLVDGSAVAASSTTELAQEVVAQAAGAVRDPGIYRLDVGARVDDLVQAAGGFTDKADPDRVNLAAALRDGERVWIPAEGETEVPVVVAGVAGPSDGLPPAGADGSEPAEPLDLNSATADQLDTLPGVGPATSTAIIRYREQSGPFRSVEDLLEVRGIGDAKLEQIRPLVRV